MEYIYLFFRQVTTMTNYSIVAIARIKFKYKNYKIIKKEKSFP
jgi:hypothetical protein